MESEKESARKTELSMQLLMCCRNELYTLFPYLDGAFAALPWEAGKDTGSFGFDGEKTVFSPGYLVRLYACTPEKLRRGYLHLLLHCLFLHPFRRRSRSRRLWNLACDMAVEAIIEKEGNPRLSIGENSVRQECFRCMEGMPPAAEEIYSRLEEKKFPFPLGAMEAAFLSDDHSLWEKAGPASEKKWQHLLSYTSRNRAGGKKAGTRAGQNREQVETPEAGKYDYRKYLRKFAVPREETELDMDSFDYIYYHFGLEKYGNLPLIEPLEYREGMKLEELVIAIDTSGSCSKEVVRSFLGETYRILSSRENFFRRMRVHLIQCDCVVQSAVVIHSGEEWKNYSREITIQGRGGTDFTPVFRYVEEKQREGKLKNLKALLYFTDGDGAYPREKTDYETAFVFLDRTEHMASVPPWAKVLLVNDRGSV